MNVSTKRNRVKPLIVAVALAFSGTAAVAATMGDVVTTRADQNIDQQYGRDSVYAFSLDSKPLKPEQNSGQSTNFFGKFKSYAANAWDKTLGAAWHKTSGFLTQQPATTVLYEPQPYGRAGGYVGSDRIAVLQSSLTPLSANSDVVKTGEASLDNVADKRAGSDAQPPSTKDNLGSGEVVTDQSQISDTMSPMPGERTSQNGIGNVSATDGSGYTNERDPEHMPNDVIPTDAMGDVSATNSSGYTDEAEPEHMPNR